MSEFRLDTLTMPAASMGLMSPLPALQRPGKHRFPREDIKDAVADSKEQRKARPRDPNDPAVRYGGIYEQSDCLPYAVLDDFGRQRQPREFQTVVLENEHLEATFILALGGRLWSLIHKPTGKRLIDPNVVFQPTLLARRGAWISGGCEWNATPGGHSPQNCDPPFAARLVADDGTPVLRLYEWERIAKIGYQVDCWLPDGSEFLFARVRVTNPHGESIPMYWWTNIAVDLREGYRVVVPAVDAISWGYSGEAGAVPIPVVHDKDVTVPTNLEGTCDFYYGIRRGQRPWLAYLDERGQGLVHASTSRLCGRKLFAWGTGPGGRRWQEFLAPGGWPYIELQAGLTQTQYTTMPMAPGADWAWVEAFGLTTTDAAKVHGPDWSAACGEVEAQLDALLPQDQLETLLKSTEAMADRPADEILQRGSGWGSLERRRREAAGQQSGWPTSLVFDDDSMGDEQAPWLELLESGAMAEPADGECPPSFMVQAQWRDMLERAVEGGCKDNWYAWLHLGVLRYATDDGSTDVAGAEQAWRCSLELAQTPWAHRDLALSAWHADRRDEAASQWMQAWQLRCTDIRLAREAAQALVRTGRGEEFLALLETMPPEIRSHPRLEILRVMCLLEKNDPAVWPEVEAFLARPAEPADMHEGEPTLSRLFYELKARKLALAEGVAVTETHRQTVRDTVACSPHLDFRQVRDPALQAKKD